MLVHARPAGGMLHALPGRIYLERTKREKEFPLHRTSAARDAVVRDQPAFRPGAAGGEGRDREREVAARPLDGRDRQVALLERLAERDVGPSDELAVDEQERLDHEARLVDLDRALGVDQRLAQVGGAADDRPVTLLGRRVARVGAARLVVRHGLKEGVRRHAEFRALHLESGERAAARRVRSHEEFQPSALLLGEINVIAAAVAVPHRRSGDPVPPVGGEEHVVSFREIPVFPVEHEPADLALVAKIEREPLISAALSGRRPIGDDRAVFIGMRAVAGFR